MDRSLGAETIGVALRAGLLAKLMSILGFSLRTAMPDAGKKRGRCSVDEALRGNDSCRRAEKQIAEIRITPEDSDARGRYVAGMR
jgi:hypothetical protein